MSRSFERSRRFVGLLALSLGAIGCGPPVSATSDDDDSTSTAPATDSGTPGTTTGTTDAPVAETGEPETTTTGGDMPSSSGGDFTTGDETTSGNPTASATDAETDTNVASTGDAPVCGGSCVEPAPEGWNGPTVRRTADSIDESACGGNFPEFAAGGFSEFSADSAECDCSCGAPEGGGCDPQVDIDVYDSECTATSGSFCTATQNLNSCDLLATSFPAGAPTFDDLDDDLLFGIRFIAEPPGVVTAPSCGIVASETIPPPSVSSFAVVCDADPLLEGTCEDDGLCVPAAAAPFTGGYCVWAEGDVECPGGEYTEREVLFAELEDTRGCTSCDCGDAQNVACAGEVSVQSRYNDGGVALDPLEFFPADGACAGRVTPNATPTNGTRYRFGYEPQLPTSTGCDPSGGMSVGDAAPAGAVTVCCGG